MIRLRRKWTRLLGMLLLASSVSVASAQDFDGLSEAIASGNYGNMKAVIITHQGDVLFEEYFRGTQRSTLHQMFSVTKSVGSTLVGILHRRGQLELDMTMETLFSEHYPMSSPQFQDTRNITIEHVLKQRHGVLWDEWTLPFSSSLNPVNQSIQSGDWYRYFLSSSREVLPDQKFAYSSIGSSLMSRMIRFATGMGPAEFAEQELFAPLGINRYHWELYSEAGRGTGLTDWPNPDGDEPLGFGLWLRAIDMQKLGELYRNGGVVNDQRLIDESWIEASWQTYSNSDNTPLFRNFPGSGYGYQWWTYRLADQQERSWTAHYANGYARQFILVYPALDLVIVSVADDYDYDGPGIGALSAEFILDEFSPALDERFGGSWYDPENDGQGFNLEILDSGTVIAYWYTYDNEGNKRWFVMTGLVEDNQADVTIFETQGGRFLAPDPVSEIEWGTGRFTTIDCGHLNFEFESAEISTSIDLTRLTGNCVQ